MQRRAALAAATTLVASLLAAVPQTHAQAEPVAAQPFRLATTAAFDISPPLRDLANVVLPDPPRRPRAGRRRPRRTTDNGYTGDGALQNSLATPRRGQDPLEQISPPRISFEGVANSANPILISPPTRTARSGPTTTCRWSNVSTRCTQDRRAAGGRPARHLFAGFPITDCTGFNGDGS